MKKFLYSILTLAAFSFAAVSCVEEEVHKPGEPDVDGCYGVYFPAQETALTLDPAEPLTHTIAVVRTVSTGDITVPVKLTDKNGVFEMSELKFEDGQTESSIELTFEKAGVGVNYLCSLSIEDPQYASTYSANPVNLDFTVIREKWNDLGMALYTDDIVTTFFNVPLGTTYEVEVQENDLVKGLYRLKNLYGAGYPYNEEGDFDASKDYWFYIHAEKADMVYFDYQGTGMDWGYGEFAIWSLAGNYLAAGKNAEAAEYFGTIKDGVIKFPSSSLLVSMANNNEGAFYYANQNGMFKIVLPGGKDVDYTLKVQTGLAEEGALPVELTLGADIASVKYAIYEGQLNSAQKASYAAAIADGSETNAKTAESELFSVSMEKTGVYTLVFVGFDADNAAQANAAVEVSFVAAGDEVPVVVSAGITATNKYAPQGFTSENSLEFYVYGKDLTSVKLGLFTYMELAADAQACLDKVAESDPVDAETLALINGDGYTDLFTKLSPGTQYGLVVIASNGYEETVVLEMAATEGDPLPVYMSYSYSNDMDYELQPQKSEGYFGTYNYYAVDAYGELGVREYIGQATIADSEIEDLPADDFGVVTEYVNINGFFQWEAAILGFKDEYVWEFYDGYLYSLADSEPLGAVTLQGSQYYAHLLVATEAAGLQLGYSSMLVGGYVADGYIAFASSELYNGGTLGEYGLRLGLFADEAYSSYAGAVAGYDDLLLVDPAKDDNGLAPAPEALATKKLQLNGLKEEICKTPMNYVETERGRMRSIIDKYNSTPRNYAGNVAGLKNAQREVKSVDFKVGTAEPFETSTNRTFKRPTEAYLVK